MGRPFDTWDNIPNGMKRYLQNFGFNFNDKMAKFAFSKMKDVNGNKYEPIPKEKVEELLMRYGVSLENDNGANSWYVCNMAKSDYWGSSIRDEQQLALFVKDFIDDKDFFSTEKPFRYFYTVCMANGIVIEWDDML